MVTQRCVMDNERRISRAFGHIFEPCNTCTWLPVYHDMFAPCAHEDITNSGCLLTSAGASLVRR